MVDLIYKIYNNQYGLAIRRGMLFVLPLILISSGLQVIVSLVNLCSNYLDVVSIDTSTLTNMNIMFLAIIKPVSVVTISYSLVKINNERNKESINPVIASSLAVSTAVFFKGSYELLYATELFSAENIVLFICVSLITVEVYSRIYRIYKEKYWRHNIGYDLLVTDTIMSIVPCMLTLFIAYISIVFLQQCIPLISLFLSSFNELINLISTSPTMSYLIDILKIQFLWFFGSPGGEIIDLNPMYASFMSVFAQLGGAGAIFGLIIAILISKTNSYYKGMANVSIFPALFNISEPITFGLPLCFNPIYFIPFLLTPIILSLVTLFAMRIGFLHLEVTIIEWSVPILLNGYLIGGVNGVIMQIVNLILATLIYLPFVILSEDIYRKLTNKSYNLLKDEVFNHPSEHLMLTKKEEDIGRISRMIGKDLKIDLSKKESNIYLEYQPQVNQEGRVCGVEALLRYKHKKLGNIPPNIVIMIAEELDLISDLGAFIFNKACTDLAKWNKTLNNPLELSVNISAHQAKDSSFYNIIKSAIELNDLDPTLIKLEITESLALGNDELTKRQLKALSEDGIKLVIDDFGPGYNPILYIKQFNIHEIKLDGSLIRDIETNKISQDIVRAMYNLSKYSNLNLVAEFVETESQKELLQQIGSMHYQGYLYSKPISAEDTLTYIQNNWKKLT